jgi:hypothetical protein
VLLAGNVTAIQVTPSREYNAFALLPPDTATNLPLPYAIADHTSVVGKVTVVHVSPLYEYDA